MPVQILDLNIRSKHLISTRFKVQFGELTKYFWPKNNFGKLQHLEKALFQLKTVLNIAESLLGQH